MTRARASRARSAAAASARPQGASVIANAAMAVRAYERQVFSESRSAGSPVTCDASEKRGV